MIRLEIKQGKLYFDGAAIGPGQPFREVLAAVDGHAYSVLEPEADGLGSFRFRDGVFCGLFCSGVFQFRGGRLESLLLTPQWKNYDLTGTDGKRHPVRQGAARVARLSDLGLEAALGKPALRGEEASLYGFGELRVSMSLTREGEGFSVLIYWQVPEIPRLGYALAPKTLVEERKKVRFCYRERPDNGSDSGWRFFSGGESQELVDDPRQIGIYDLATIGEIDPDVIPLLELPYGAVLVREDAAQPFRPDAGDN